MQKPYRTVEDIKAVVTERWNHHNCKFKPGDHAEVTAQVLPRQYLKMDGGIGDGHSYVSKIKQRRVGRVGKVVAVSVAVDGKIRGKSVTGFCERMYTRYYIQFKDGVIMGYDSHHLNKAFGS